MARTLSRGTGPNSRVASSLPRTECEEGPTRISGLRHVRDACCRTESVSRHEPLGRDPARLASSAGVVTMAAICPGSPVRRLIGSGRFRPRSPSFAHVAAGSQSSRRWCQLAQTAGRGDGVWSGKRMLPYFPLTTKTCLRLKNIEGRSPNRQVVRQPA